MKLLMVTEKGMKSLNSEQSAYQYSCASQFNEVQMWGSLWHKLGATDKNNNPMGTFRCSKIHCLNINNSSYNFILMMLSDVN